MVEYSKNKYANKYYTESYIDMEGKEYGFFIEEKPVENVLYSFGEWTEKDSEYIRPVKIYSLKDRNDFSESGFYNMSELGLENLLGSPIDTKMQYAKTLTEEEKQKTHEIILRICVLDEKRSSFYEASNWDYFYVSLHMFVYYLCILGLECTIAEKSKMKEKVLQSLQLESTESLIQKRDALIREMK